MAFDITSSPIGLVINFDSMSEAFGFPTGFRDPSYFIGYDRLMEAVNKFDLKLTIFVIGRDLENREVFDRVRDWTAEGHEIGNHSWSHKTNMGALPERELHDEIHRAHDLISNCCGVEPIGFSSPGWSTSRKLVAHLIDLNYVYDTSVFPTFALYPIVLKVALNHFGDWKRMWQILDRRDWLMPATVDREPFVVDRNFKKVTEQEKDSLVIFPLPSLGRFNITIWHTVGFVLGWPRFFPRLEKALERLEGFYYLMHPADFVSREDADPDRLYTHSLERLDISIDRKIEMMERVFEVMKNSNRPPKQMGEMASCYLKKAR